MSTLVTKNMLRSHVFKAVCQRTARQTATSLQQTRFLSTSVRLQAFEVGEMEGSKFKIEPIQRTNESVDTMRARLLCMYHWFLPYI
jgi:hypothetical protein